MPRHPIDNSVDSVAVKKVQLKLDGAILELAELKGVKFTSGYLERALNDLAREE